MNTTDQLTDKVPAWLNLDGVCPPEVRGEMADLAEEVEDTVRRLDGLARRSFEALRKAEDAMPGAVRFEDGSAFDPLGEPTPISCDAPYDLFGVLSGSARLRSSWYRLAELARAGADDPEQGMCADWWTDRDGRDMAEIRKAATELRKQ